MIYSKENEAKLYYLYMMADGGVSPEEKKLFKKICKELDVDDEKQTQIIYECSVMDKENSTNIFDIIKKEKLDESLSNRWMPLKKNDSKLTRIIWNLVNLGYSDIEYSNEEKDIVSYLIGKWKIDNEIYIEMIDSAETIQALVDQKKWVKKNISDKNACIEQERTIDSEIKKITKDLATTLEELSL